MAEIEIKNCQNCKKDFTIEQEDFDFYKKIDVPSPTWCPECRMVRRGQFRNEWSFFKRPCDLCKTEVISIYSTDTPFPVYCDKCYWSDNWNPLSFGQEYDFSKSFFEQFQELSKKVPRIAIMNRESVGSPYSHLSSNNKNSYFLVESSFNENLHYGYWMQRSKDSIDNAFDTNSELCYETIGVFDSYKLKYSEECFSCSESWFLKNCTDCHNCFGSINLKHKKYYFLNKPYSKEEYEKKLEELRLHTHEGVEAAKKLVDDFHKSFPRRFAEIINSPNSTGNYITNSKNCRDTFYSFEAEDCRYGVHILGLKDSYDVDTAGINASLLYEVLNTALGVERMFFTNRCWTGHDIFYSENLDNCEYCFGSISLKKNSYCILNRQYTKEEYLELLPKIIIHMKDSLYKNDRGQIFSYGEFFPPEFSPFAYNQTIAQDYSRLTKNQVLERGYRWKDSQERNNVIDIQASELPRDEQNKAQYADRVIGCSHKGECQDLCTGAYRLTKDELSFYERFEIPLPRICPHCRHGERLRRLNLLKLWARSCDCSGIKSKNGLYANVVDHFHNQNPCSNTFQTSYAPERPEIVYCGECYKAEVV